MTPEDGAKQASQPRAHPPRVVDLSEQSQLLVFEADIQPDINQRVLCLTDFLQQKLGADIRLSPAYHSLLIEWPALPDTVSLKRALADFDALDDISRFAPSGRCWQIPVCYGGEYGADLKALAKARGLSSEQLIQIHSSGNYRVFLLGFAPGYAYLGPLDKRLHSPRRDQPRASTPAGSISIGGQQTLIAGVSMPSGWHLIGRTPIHSFCPDLDSPSLFRAGDSIRFQSIGEQAFQDWQTLTIEQQWQQLAQSRSEHGATKV